MANALKQRKQLAVVSVRPTPHETSFSDKIAVVAALGARAIPGGRCAIAWSDAGAERVLLAPANDSRWDKVIVAVLAALDNRLSDAAASGPKQPRATSSSVDSATLIEKVALSARAIDAIMRANEIGDASVQLAASAFTDGAIRVATSVRAATSETVRIVLVGEAPNGQPRPPDELEALLELLAHAVFAETALGNASASMEFWRTYGRDRSRDASIAKRDLSRERDAARNLDAAVGALRQAPPKERLARFGAIVAAHCGFDQWIVATPEDGGFKVTAASPSLIKSDLERPRGALEESFQRRTVIACADFADAFAGNADRLSYVCIPFDAGAVALASREDAGPLGRADAETIVARLGPIVTSWVMERQAASRRELVRHLALRMFTAIDEERTRIARDLHDDQAQLLAAAKIALEGGREEARGIFKQIENELRRKTRELRPATLGRATLDEAIEREFRRLADSGIAAKLIHAGASHENEISRPVQQLCFQVLREVLSNVIRHACATSVEVIVERTSAAARISVSDDGRGIDSPDNGEGTGLAGMRERLELMGGSLTVQSRAGRTTILAEIPEPV